MFDKNSKKKAITTATAVKPEGGTAAATTPAPAAPATVARTSTAAPAASAWQKDLADLGAAVHANSDGIASLVNIVAGINQDHAQHLRVTNDLADRVGRLERMFYRASDSTCCSDDCDNQSQAQRGQIRITPVSDPAPAPAQPALPSTSRVTIDPTSAPTSTKQVRRGYLAVLDYRGRVDTRPYAWIWQAEQASPIHEWVAVSCLLNSDGSLGRVLSPEEMQNL